MHVAHCRMHGPQGSCPGELNRHHCMLPSCLMMICCASVWNTDRREIDRSSASANSWKCVTTDLQAAAVGPVDASASSSHGDTSQLLLRGAGAAGAVAGYTHGGARATGTPGRRCQRGPEPAQPGQRCIPLQRARVCCPPRGAQGRLPRQASAPGPCCPQLCAAVRRPPPPANV